MTFVFGEWGYLTTNALGGYPNNTIKTSPIFTPHNLDRSYYGVHATVDWTDEPGLHGDGIWLDYRFWYWVDGSFNSGSLIDGYGGAVWSESFEFSGGTPDGSAHFRVTYFGPGIDPTVPHTITVQFGLYGQFDPPGYRFISPPITIFTIPDPVPTPIDPTHPYPPNPTTPQQPLDTHAIAILIGDSQISTSELETDSLPGLARYDNNTLVWRRTDFNVPVS